jgi:hypothetical protein
MIDRKTDCLTMGEWKQNQLNGYGEIRWKDGKKYIGFFLNNEKDGFGVQILPNPVRSYVGFWKGNKQHGIGFVINDKLHKFGLWEDGNRVKWYQNHHEARRNISKEHEFFFKKYMKHSREDAMEFLSNYI